jgi:two-component system, sensor histidine kinase and response regulator
MVDDMASGKNIKVNNLLPDKVFVHADTNMVRTILRNLITNAVKFTHKNGSIEISAKTVEQSLEISISDSGIGMDEATISKLFKIDSNLTTRGTENEKGTGLGLFLCKEFVEKHGGRIWCESRKGAGSIFRFTLPLDLSE